MNGLEASARWGCSHAAPQSCPWCDGDLEAERRWLAAGNRDHRRSELFRLTTYYRSLGVPMPAHIASFLGVSGVD